MVITSERQKLGADRVSPFDLSNDVALSDTLSGWCSSGLAKLGAGVWETSNSERFTADDELLRRLPKCG